MKWGFTWRCSNKLVSIVAISNSMRVLSDAMASGVLVGSRRRAPGYPTICGYALSPGDWRLNCKGLMFWIALIATP